MGSKRGSPARVAQTGRNDRSHRDPSHSDPSHKDPHKDPSHETPRGPPARVARLAIAQYGLERLLNHIRALTAGEQAGPFTTDLIELLNETPKRRAIKRIPAKYLRLLNRTAKAVFSIRRASAALCVELGRIPGAQSELMCVRSELLLFEECLYQESELLLFEERLYQEDNAAFRELLRQRHQVVSHRLLKNEGTAAGAAAYKGEYRNTVQPEPRAFRCALGNEVAQHNIRCCVKAWFEGYAQGYEAAGCADGWIWGPSGVDDPKKPVPHPDFSPAMHEAFTRTTLQQARAGRARGKKYADVARDFCETYRKGDIRDQKGKSIFKKEAAAIRYYQNTYCKNLPPGKKSVFISDEAAYRTLKLALDGVKPRRPDTSPKDASTALPPRAPKFAPNLLH